MPTTDELNERVEKLEKSSGGFRHFAGQYFLAPLLVIVVGWYFNSKIEDAKQQMQSLELELKRVQIAQELIKDLSSENYERAFMTIRLLKKVLDKDLIDEFLDINKKKFEEARTSKEIENVGKLVAAAKTLGGQTGQSLVKSLEEGKFHVVVASASTEAAAIAQTEELRKKNYPSEAYLTPSGSYAVTIGRSSFEEATSQRVKVIQGGIAKDAWLSQGKTWLKKVSP